MYLVFRETRLPYLDEETVQCAENLSRFVADVAFCLNVITDHGQLGNCLLPVDGDDVVYVELSDACDYQRAGKAFLL